MHSHLICISKFNYCLLVQAHLSFLVVYLAILYYHFNINLFFRLADSDEKFITTITQIYGFILLRPANKTSVYFEDKHSIRLLRDLIVNYDSIFKNLNI